MVTVAPMGCVLNPSKEKNFSPAPGSIPASPAWGTEPKELPEPLGTSSLPERSLPLPSCQTQFWLLNKAFITFNISRAGVAATNIASCFHAGQCIFPQNSPAIHKNLLLDPKKPPSQLPQSSWADHWLVQSFQNWPHLSFIWSSLLNLEIKGSFLRAEIFLGVPNMNHCSCQGCAWSRRHRGLREGVEEESLQDTPNLNLSYLRVYWVWVFIF